MPPRLVLAALFVAGLARVGHHGAPRRPAQRRGADAAGRRADRRGAGALPRLLVVLSPRPALPAGRAAGALRAVAADVAPRARARGRDASPCSPTRSRGGRPGRARRCWRGSWRSSRWPTRAARTRSRSRSPSRSARCSPSRRARCSRACSRARRGVADRVRRLRGRRDPARAPGGRCAASRSPPRRRPRVLYVPVVVAAGVGPSWDLLVDYPLTDFRDYQSLPFPLSYDGPLNTGSPGGFFTDWLEPLLLFYLPLALVLGLAGGAVALARRPRAPRVIATAVLAIGVLAYLLVRTDLFHTAPLAVLVACSPRGRSTCTAVRRVPAALAGWRCSTRSWRGSTAARSCCARTPSRSTSPSPTACACRRARRPSSRRVVRAAARPRPDLRRDPARGPGHRRPSAALRPRAARPTRPATTSPPRAW